jgi:integrase
MPRKAEALSAVEVKRLTRPGFYAVGGVSGLHLQVTGTGARSWILRAKVGLKRRDIGLGGYPDVPLAQARDKAREAREAIKDGIDPVEQRKAARLALMADQAKSITFRDAARRYLEIKSREFRNPKHIQQWTNTLETYAHPIIGPMRVSEIELAHIVQLLEPIWQTKTETATRVRGRIEAVLAWATVSGFRAGENPARLKDNVDLALGRPAKMRKVNHFRALPYSELPAFMQRLRARPGTSARALEFAILTAGRSGEVRGATWPEIDLDAAIWTIPGERMKSGKPHRVPLSPTAITLLKGLPQMVGEPHLFPAPRGGSMSDVALTALLKRMQEPVTAHGFRSTFKDWAREQTNYADEVSELALAHVNSDATRAAYARSELIDKRRQLMQEWERYADKGAIE